MAPLPSMMSAVVFLCKKCCAIALSGIGLFLGGGHAHFSTHICAPAHTHQHAHTQHTKTQHIPVEVRTGRNIQNRLLSCQRRREWRRIHQKSLKFFFGTHKLFVGQEPPPSVAVQNEGCRVQVRVCNSVFYFLRSSVLCFPVLLTRISACNRVLG